jgi:APA family basic amino acid/polyamine antiporter
MYAYSGWNASTYIIGEIREPERNVPRSLVAGTLIVLVLYVVLNAVFLHISPMGEMDNQPNVASVAARHTFGAAGGRAMDGLICFGFISTISSMVWIGPRVTATMGEDLPALRLLGRKTRSGIPRVAIVLQLLVATLLLYTTTFEFIVSATLLTLTLCSFLTVLGVIVLRIRRPDLHRPYRTWGYPITPIIFLAISLWMAVHLLVSSPKQSLLGLGTTLTGLIVYFATRRHRHPTVG